MKRVEPFSERLLAAKEHGKLTARDLMVWFERPYSTVHSWLQGGTPQGYYLKLMEARLKLLERTFARAPLNPQLRQKERKARVRKLLADAIVSQPPTAS